MNARNAKTTQGATTPDGEKNFLVPCGRALKKNAGDAVSGKVRIKRVSEPTAVYETPPGANGSSRTRERTVTVTPRTASVQLSAELGGVVVMSPKKSPSVSRRTIRKAVETVVGKRITARE